MTKGDTELLKVDLGQVGQHIGVDFALAECGFILAKAKASQPTPDIHGRAPASSDS